MRKAIRRKYSKPRRKKSQNIGKGKKEKQKSVSMKTEAKLEMPRLGDLDSGRAPKARTPVHGTKKITVKAKCGSFTWEPHWMGMGVHPIALQE